MFPRRRHDHPDGEARNRLAALIGDLPAPAESLVGVERVVDGQPLGEGRARGGVGRLVERWVPDRLRGSRLDLGRRGLAVVAVVAALAAVAAVVGVWWDRPVPEPAPVLPVARSSPRTSTSGVPGGPLVVSVVGKVVRPGLVSLPEGARVADAVQASGGALPDVDLSGLNLARRLTDGEQLDVGAPSTSPVDGGGVADATGKGHSTGKVNLNTATVAQLHGLPGVGPVTAQRIVDWRTKHGRFSSVQQLREVGGIGESRLAKLKDLVVL